MYLPGKPKFKNVTQGIELTRNCKSEIVYITITSVLLAAVLRIHNTNYL